MARPKKAAKTPKADQTATAAPDAAARAQTADGAEAAPGADGRVIKKYSNRRLYDTQDSRYITLDELKDLVVGGEELRVLTASGEDITRQTLISILLSGEVMGQPMFSEQTLRNMVMFMQGPMRAPMKIFFEQCMPMFARGNSELMQKFGHAASGRELDNLAALQGNMVRQVMEQYVFRTLEGYLTTQKNMEKMMAMQNPFSFGGMFPVQVPDAQSDDNAK